MCPVKHVVNESNKTEMDKKNKKLNKQMSSEETYSEDESHHGRAIIHIRLKTTHKLTFFLGVVFGVFALRHQLLIDTSQTLTEWAQGYEFDNENQCVVVRKKKTGAIDYCRPLIDCKSVCEDVRQIDNVHSTNMTKKLFLEVYATSGRPVVVKNATSEWPAMEAFTFHFFRDLYELLDSPVLQNNDPDCAFFAWEKMGDEFFNVQSVFDMPEQRITYAEKFHKTNDTTDEREKPRELLHNQPWYVGWANCDDEAAEILKEYYSAPSFLPEDAEAGSRDWIFIGTPGYGAPFHLDNVKFPSWQAQISGIKSWAFKPPPECWWRCPGEVKTTVNPGDIIVFNSNWWFHSTGVIEGTSVTITNEFII